MMFVLKKYRKILIFLFLFLAILTILFFIFDKNEEYFRVLINSDENHSFETIRSLNMGFEERLEKPDYVEVGSIFVLYLTEKEINYLKNLNYTLSVLSFDIPPYREDNKMNDGITGWAVNNIDYNYAEHGTSGYILSPPATGVTSAHINISGDNCRILVIGTDNKGQSGYIFSNDYFSIPAVKNYTFKTNPDLARIKIIWSNQPGKSCNPNNVKINSFYLIDDSGLSNMIGMNAQFFDWKYYNKYSTVVSTLKKLAEDNPSIAKYSELSTSTSDKMPVLKISDNVELESESTKEVSFVIMARIHGDEALTTEAALYSAFFLVNNYNKDPEIKKLIDNREIWIIPIINTYGAQRYENLFSSKFLTDYIQSVTASPGRWNSNGVNLNRDFSVGWARCDDCGPTPFSQQETKSIRDLIEKIKPHYIVSLHGYGGTVMAPYFYKYEKAHPDFEIIGRAVAQELGFKFFYHFRSPYDGSLSIVNGAFADWAHKTTGAFALEIEMSSVYYGDHPKSDIMEKMVKDFARASIAVLNDPLNFSGGIYLSSCTPNWQSGSWSTCVSGIQNRSVTDLNNCGIMDGQPSNSQSCVSVCTPNWQSGSWSTCVSGIQNRSVTDLNNCNIDTNKPLSSQGCTPTCTPNWQSGSWSTCVSGSQTRSVTDLNNCGIMDGQPSNSQSCVSVSQVSYCKSECLSGQKRCVGNSYEICNNSDFGGCMKWGERISCLSNQECMNGECVNISIVKIEEEVMCVDSDWTQYLEECNSSNLQTKKWFKINECSGGVSRPSIEIVECNYNSIECVPNWECINWSDSCVNNFLARVCIDTNNCNTNKNKPEEKVFCDQSDYDNKKEDTKNNKYLWIIFFAAIIIVFAAIYLFKIKKDNKNQAPPNQNYRN
jgi:hypothetical protein